jgi:hypothetical protein
MVHDPNSRTSVLARLLFSNACALFLEDFLFLQFDSAKTQFLMSELGVTAPRLLFYRGAAIEAHYDFQLSPHFLLSVLEFHSHTTPQTSVTDWEMLHRTLGVWDVSLVYPIGRENVAVKIHNALSVKFGSLELVPYEGKVVEGGRPGQFYLYRGEDLALVEVAPTIRDVAANWRPVFRRFQGTDLKGTMVFAIVAMGYTPEIMEILEAVATKFRRYSVGLIEPDLHEVANASVGRTLAELPAIAVFNLTEHIYAPVPPDLVCLKGMTCADVLSKIERWLAFPRFMRLSEPRPPAQDGPCVTLVGETHDAFVRDPATVVVLYLGPWNSKSRRCLDVFELAAKRATPRGVKFGVINVTVNLASYPMFTAIPKIEVFPAGDKNNSKPFFGRWDADSILRFVSSCAGAPVAEDISSETRRDRMFEILNIWKQLDYLQDTDLVAAERRLDELDRSINAKWFETIVDSL